MVTSMFSSNHIWTQETNIIDNVRLGRTSENLFGTDSSMTQHIYNKVLLFGD